MKITDGRQLDYTRAKRAALAIAKKCEDSGFTAPDNLEIHQHHILFICAAMNEITKALHLITPEEKP
jgi:hypothetical protein